MQIIFFLIKCKNSDIRRLDSAFEFVERLRYKIMLYVSIVRK